MAPLEKLPIEIFQLISRKLAFFDQISLAATSTRSHHLSGPLKCPDFLSKVMRTVWLAYQTNNYDYTVLNPKDLVCCLGIAGLAIRREAEKVASDYHPWGFLKEKRTRLGIFEPYFPLQHRREMTEALHHTRTLGIFMMYHVQEYTKKACEEKRAWANGGAMEGNREDDFDLEWWDKAYRYSSEGLKDLQKCWQMEYHGRPIWQ